MSNPIHLVRKLHTMIHRDLSDRMGLWNRLAGKIKGFISEHSRAVGPLRVLDLGCGAPYWASVAFQAWGWDVTGVDIEDARPRPAYLRMASSMGVAFAVKRFLKDKLVFPRMYDEWIKSLGVSVDYRKIDIRQIGGRRLPFDDATFDFIHSHVVLEHVEDVPALLDDVNRVLKPDGVTLHMIHLFPSIRGGHTCRSEDCLTTTKDEVRPWDHLRGGPSLAGLNKLRLADYRKLFDQRFEVMDWVPSTGGKELLTEEIKAELPDYTEEDLLTVTVTVGARKKQAV